MLFQHPPDYSSLRVLGCACWPHLRPYVRHKMEPRSAICIILGYALNYKGYFCFDPKTGCIYISRDVKFDEKFFPSDHQSSSFQNNSISTYVQLPHLNSLPTLPSQPNSPLIPSRPLCLVSLVLFPHIRIPPLIHLTRFLLLHCRHLSPSHASSLSDLYSFYVYFACSCTIS